MWYSYTIDQELNPNIYGINIACVEGIKPFEIKNVPVNDGENHPLDKKIIFIMNLVNDCFFKVKKDCYKFISSEETKKEKFKNKDKMIKSYLIPVCFWIAKKVNKKKTIIIGLSGGQGTGKTTISSIIKFNFKNILN